jgi:hypothetical protein
LGGRDQEDHSSKPTQVNGSRDPILKIPNTKKTWLASYSSYRAPAWQMQDPVFKPQYHKKKKSSKSNLNVTSTEPDLTVLYVLPMEVVLPRKLI